ncbi:floral homeotic protein (HUA1) [Wolffia australiana]
MAKQLFGYGSSYGTSYGGPGLSSTFSARAGDGDQYYSEASLLGPSSQVSGMESYTMGKYAGGYGGASVPSYNSQLGFMDSSLLPGLKRPPEALYHQSLLGNHNSIGQNEGLLSTNPLLKRPRYDIGSHLPIYPQRPGEKDCAHYMLTRTCKFGDNCKFDHPLWVPEGGIPDWKEVPVVNDSESLPERPGQSDCPYFLKTQKCKFGSRCKFNHPKDKVSEMPDASVLPERPSEPICSFYAKTGKCKFGVNCIFHHPKDLQLSSNGQDPANEPPESGPNGAISARPDLKAVNPASFAPALFHNSKGLPIRPGEQDCPFYVKTGSCKYGTGCRFNHPDRHAFNPITAPSYLQSPNPNLSAGVLSPPVSLLPSLDTRFSQTTIGVAPTLYPQRPGQMECDFYMKTGQCKFWERCKFHHPVDRSAPSSTTLKHSTPQSIKLTLAGLPRREGAIICPYYLKTGTCKFGPTCKFDHPTPAEAIAMAAAKETPAAAETEKDPAEKDLTQPL